MENHNNISDKDLNRLLKQRLLELDDDALLEAEAKLAFSSTVIVVPDLRKEEAFLKKLKKTKARFWKWFFPGMVILIGIPTFFYLYQPAGKSSNEGSTVADESNLQMNVCVATISSAQFCSVPPENEVMLLSPDRNTLTVKENDTVSSSANRTGSVMGDCSSSEMLFTHRGLGIYKGQLIDRISKPNGSFSTPVIMRDSIVVLVHPPLGSRAKLDVLDKALTSEDYFEDEHRTVWYKFSVKDNCKLAFDISPNNDEDDFNFSLFQYNGPNFSLQVQNKKVIPIRTCISSNNRAIKSKTGLSYDEQAPAFVQSVTGQDYVKYVRAQKGQIFYLAVRGADSNIGSHAIGHESGGYTIRLHYKKYDPNELYVGKSILAKEIYFVADRYVFLPNSGYEDAIDSIYYFLKSKPKIKVEIQGHVNSMETQKEKGKKTRSQELSENRAKAVRECLIEKGIDPLRMVPKGYAGTRKKIWNPKSISESSKNVRVDVIILSLDYEADLKGSGYPTAKNEGKYDGG